jgi:hypothetical protein
LGGIPEGTWQRSPACRRSQRVLAIPRLASEAAGEEPRYNVRATQRVAANSPKFGTSASMRNGNLS